MTPDDLRTRARQLANTYATLAELKWTPERSPNVKVMRSQDGPKSPSPDGDWALNLEHELMRETTDEHIPGGLRAMAYDALGYTLAPPHARPDCRVGYLDEDCTPGILCAHIARRAHEVVANFPAAEDLADLLTQQYDYLTRQLDHRHHTSTRLTPIPADTMATGFGTAADLAPLVSAAIGRHIDRKQVTYWGRSGRITAYTQPDGTTQYRLDQTINAAREYTDKRTGHTAT